MATQLIFSATTTKTGTPVAVPVGNHTRTYSASVDGSGAVSATVIIYGSNDGMKWRDLGTITLSGTNSDSDGFPSVAPWAWVRADVTAIGGTDANAHAYMGV